MKKDVFRLIKQNEQNPSFLSVINLFWSVYIIYV